MRDHSLCRSFTLVPVAVLGAAALVSVACSSSAGMHAGTADGRPYLERRAAHVTHLSRHGPMTAASPREDAPEGATRLTYRSGALELWGWYLHPPGAEPAPALVYFNGGNDLTRAKFQKLRAFVNDGVAVLAATLRGRNGNPGDFELNYGEVDDARAAVAAIAARPDVDAAHIYAFGHSMGGAVAAQLALYPDAPVRITGSSGSIYSPRTFAGWAKGGDSDIVRFDVNDADEVQLRLLLPFAGEIAHPHVAYMGTEEATTRRNADAAAKRAHAAGKSFDVVQVPGDHFGALPHALDDFRRRIAADAAR